MSKEAEYRAGIRSTESSIDSKKSTKRDLEAKIERLEEAYRQVSGIKPIIDDLKREVARKNDQSETWKGMEHSWYSGYITDSFGASYKIYYDGLDEYHDAIMAEITRLQNEVIEIGWALSGLFTRLNDLRSWLRQLLN
jgi:chromosome segregation ATPase